MNSSKSSASGAVDASLAPQGNHLARPVLDAISDRMQSARDRAGPALRGLADDAQDLVHAGSLAIGRRGRQARDASTGWVRERPLRAVLVAAGAGAALALLAGWIARFNSRLR